MLKLPKGLKKKKKGKKAKRKGEEELFTEEELKNYRREHQQQSTENGEGTAKENEEWSKFKDITTGIDSVLKKTQGDLDRIKSTSFFQRIPVRPKKVEPEEKQVPHRQVVELTEADFPQLVQSTLAEADDGNKSDYGATDDESEEEDQDDIFDTSYVEAVERGEVKLAYIPDSPEEFQDDGIFDTSHVDALIKGQEVKSSKGKQSLDIGLAVGVLTGRIDNVTITTKRHKRVIPGDLLLENTEGQQSERRVETVVQSELIEKSILDIDSDIPITGPIDLSVSLHTTLGQQNNTSEQPSPNFTNTDNPDADKELDEFTLLAEKSLEVSSEVIKTADTFINLEPVFQESWSAFEADKNKDVFTASIVEDQIDDYFDQDDPFDTSFADAVIPVSKFEVRKEAVVLEEDDDFDPRAEEVQVRLNNRRKSSVRIHLTNPLGLRESITSDDNIDKEKTEVTLDLLGGSTTDLTQLDDSPLDPVDVTSCEIDPFDTTIVDSIIAPGKVELKLLEQELIASDPTPIYRVPSDPDFDPRAEEPKKPERRASRPENLTVSKNVIFDIDSNQTVDSKSKIKTVKPVTPYYTRELSITEDAEEEESADTVSETLTRTRSIEDLTQKIKYQNKRRHSEYSQSSNIKLKVSDLLHSSQTDIKTKVLTPSEPERISTYVDPFDTSFANNSAPSKTELKLLAKEFSCEEVEEKDRDLLDPSDDIFQAKALSPEPPEISRLPPQDFDPFDTSFATDLHPGKTELKLLESEFLG